MSEKTDDEMTIEEKKRRLEEIELTITTETGDWICHLDGIWMGENGPRFSMMVIDNLRGMHEERMPESHREWLENHTCWLCDDSVNRIPEHIKDQGRSNPEPFSGGSDWR